MPWLVVSVVVPGLWGEGGRGSGAVEGGVSEVFVIVLGSLVVRVVVALSLVVAWLVGRWAALLVAVLVGLVRPMVPWFVP